MFKRLTQTCCCLLLCLMCAFGYAENALDGLTPPMILFQARSMFPQEHLEITGTLETSESRGLNATIRPYALTFDWMQENPTALCKIFAERNTTTPSQVAKLKRVNGTTSLSLRATDGSEMENVRLNTPIADTDLTWIDLTFNYLWWTKVKQLTETEMETRHLDARQGGRNCVILEVFPPNAIAGLHSMLLWVDISTGFLVQTEQIDAREAWSRRMWVQRIGRENGRWIPREFRIQVKGMNRVTKLKIATVKASSFAIEEN